MSRIKRNTHLMHHGRWSALETRYFITICTIGRSRTLALPTLAHRLQSAWDELSASGDIGILCRTVMPDHVHILLRLGRRLSLGQVVAKWKVQTRLALADAKLAWQRDFFERRLRPDESQESFGLYTFLNPYRAQLIGLNKCWPWWRLDEPSGFEFPKQVAVENRPRREWLEQVDAWRQTRGW